MTTGRWFSATIGLILLTAACREQSTGNYESYADAGSAGAVRQGWIPAYVPKSATQIAEVHDLDLNTQRLRFRAPTIALRSMTSGMQPLDLKTLPRSDVRTPKLSGPWPTVLQDDAASTVRADREVGLFFIPTEGPSCVAVDWTESMAYAWTCTPIRPH